MTRHRILTAFAFALVVTAACGRVPIFAPPPTPAPPPTVAPPPTAAPSPSEIPVSVSENQPYLVTGEFTYTNDIITTYYVEQAVVLADMFGFVTRDQEWETPVDSQALGFLKIDEAQKHATYRLQLPARPAGNLADVDHDGKQDTGVQIFAVAYSPNLTGGPFSEGDDPSRGWPNYLASVIADPENKQEVIGGKLIVWSPDAGQQFPTAFGPDGLLFTDDDPVGPIPAGYAVVDLDQTPFAVTQEAEPQLTLYEPQDVAVKDFSNLSYSAAFKKMFDEVRAEYAFNGVPGKEPDWDSLFAELSPRVADAESQHDAKAFFLALKDFTLAFHDGHVGVSGGEVEGEIFQELTTGGYGFALRELDDGRAIVIFVLEDGPAAKAGMQVGAEVRDFNGKPIAQAIGEVKPFSAPFSTESSVRYQQARYLLRAPEGAQAAGTFVNPGGAPRTVTLTSVAERESFAATSIFKGSDPNALPVEFRILDSGIGYVKINSNYDDLGLIIRLFERALKTFEQNQAPGIIIDLRQNTGGAPLSLAGFLTDQEIPMGQLEYYSEKTGKFEPEGPREKVRPMEHQYRFDKMALLVDQACFSACEIEAYGFSQAPGMIVVGQYPTSGTEAEVARGQFTLPEGMTLQVPTGRFTLPDGSIFLEGKGVVPTVRVPINAEMVMAEEDVVLKTAEKELGGS